MSAIGGWATVGVGGLVEGVSIILASCFIITITTVADYFKDRRFVKLQDMIKDENITVIRGRLGATKSVNIWDLVVGDIIMIDTGARVPADCMIIESTADLKVEEPWSINPSM